MIVFVIAVMLSLWAVPCAADQHEAPQYAVKRQDVEKLSRAMQDEFAGLQYLLNGYQIKQFLSLPDDDHRVEWLRIFWKQRDPTPTTEKNEMEIEHNVRVKLARQFFGSKKWPGWDKRGETFIRYGPPDYRGKIWGEVTLRGMDPPGELWYYRKQDMLVSFQNFGLKGEYIYSIDPLGAAENISPDLAEFLIYDSSGSLTQKIPSNLLEYYESPSYGATPQFVTPAEKQQYLLAKPPELPADIDAIMDPDEAEMLPKDVSALFQKDKVTESANNFQAALDETPVAYPFNFDQNPLPFYFGVDQFKGGASRNRVDVNIELPVSSQSGQAPLSKETFTAEVVVWDPDYREVTRQSKTIVLVAGPDVTRWANVIPTQIVFSLPMGYYRMAISVEGQESGRSSSYRTSFDCKPFGKRLAVSDIVFARRIAPAETPSIFTRGPLEVIPHPLHAYSRSFPMPIYFEIYNLTLDDRGASSYTIEYKITPHSDVKQGLLDRFRSVPPPASSRFQATGFGPDETQHITINTENLRKGSYDFLITLTDDITQQTIYRRGSFSLID